MPALIVPRPSSIGHFVIGGAIVVLVQSLSLMPVNLGFLGSPWPYAIIWAIAGWSVLGPDWRIGSLILILGILNDYLCAATVGTNALLYLLTYGGTLLIARVLGFIAKGEQFEGVIVFGLYLIAAVVTGLIVGTIPNVFRMLAPAVLTVALYPFMARFFIVTREVA